MRRKLAFLAVVSGFTAACGGPGSFNGTVDGKSLTVEDAIFVPDKDSNGKTTGVFLVLADVPDLCSVVKANRDPKGATWVMFGLARYSSDGKVLAPDKGEYKVVSELSGNLNGNVAAGVFNKSDANCSNEVPSDRRSAKSGLLTVDSIDLKQDGSMVGTFDVTFGTQADKVTGSFHATYCDFDIDSKPNCE